MKEIIFLILSDILSEMFRVNRYSRRSDRYYNG